MLRETQPALDTPETCAVDLANAEPTNAASPQSAPTRWLTRARVKWTAIGFVAGFLALILILLITAPLSKSLQPITTPSVTLLSADGRPIARRGAVVESAVDVQDLPEHVVQPFLAIEDRRFYSHFGIDPQGLARAAYRNWQEGGVVEGGSTITQQLAKLAFLSPERTVWRKLQEIVLAFWLEARLGKDEILSRYLSSVYFGDNVFGLRAAARHYFSVAPDELRVEQAAMLAGLLKAPTTFAPTRNLGGARERAAVVIRAMVDAEMLTKQDADGLPEVKLKTGGLKKLPSGSYFADWVFPQAEATLDDKYPAHTIATTLEDRLQRAALDAVRGVGTRGAQVALVAMRPDGRVVAMVGGREYERSPFNRATQALRQPGSTFKLFVYLAALREGYKPSSPVEDRPLRIGDWRPQNYGREYQGDITLRKAFATSSNVAAVRLGELIGRDKVIAAARDLGVEGELERGPTMALGTSGVSLIDLVSAYAAVAAGHYPVQPRGVPLPASGAPGTMPMEPGVRAAMLELLWAAANEGSGRGARLPTRTYGKTGTSQDSRDAYFIGFSKDLIAGVWIGYDDNRPMPGAQGGGVPAAIWRNFMMRALAPPDSASRARPERREPQPRPRDSSVAMPANREFDLESPDFAEGDLPPIILDEPTAEMAQDPIITLPEDQALPAPIPESSPPPAPEAAVEEDGITEPE